MYNSIVYFTNHVTENPNDPAPLKLRKIIDMVKKKSINFKLTKVACDFQCLKSVYSLLFELPKLELGFLRH